MAGVHNRMWAITGEDEFQRRTFMRRFGLVWRFKCEWTGSCAGCFEGGDYGGLAHHYSYDQKAQCHIGSGCDECGYTGKIRSCYWLPASMATQIVLNVRRRCRMARTR